MATVPEGSDSNWPLVDDSRASPNLHPDVHDVVDLSNTVDTTVHTRHLPAVTHERITPHVHTIREEVVTREIHTHDVIHRVQPIVETEVLPTKHFIQNADGTLTEIPASAVPGRVGNWHVAPGPVPESAAEDSRASESAIPPRSSSLRATGSDAPVQTSYVDPTSTDGILRSETIWKHPPQYDQRDPEFWAKTATIIDHCKQPEQIHVPVLEPVIPPVQSESDYSEDDFHDAHTEVESPVRYSVNYDRLSSEKTAANPTSHSRNSSQSSASGVSRVVSRAKDASKKAKDRLSGRFGHSRDGSAGIEARMKELNIEKYSGKLSFETTASGTRVTTKSSPSNIAHGIAAEEIQDRAVNKHR